MDGSTRKPDLKHQVRAYLQQRTVEKTPPPSIDEIRRQLGWYLPAPAKRGH